MVHYNRKILLKSRPLSNRVIRSASFYPANLARPFPAALPGHILSPMRKLLFFFLSGIFLNKIKHFVKLNSALYARDPESCSLIRQTAFLPVVITSATGPSVLHEGTFYAPLEVHNTRRVPAA
jgi:hypothetical protein